MVCIRARLPRHRQTKTNTTTQHTQTPMARRRKSLLRLRTHPRTILGLAQRTRMDRQTHTISHTTVRKRLLPRRTIPHTTRRPLRHTTTQPMRQMHTMPRRMPNKSTHNTKRPRRTQMPQLPHHRKPRRNTKRSSTKNVPLLLRMRPLHESMPTPHKKSTRCRRSTQTEPRNTQHERRRLAKTQYTTIPNTFQRISRQTSQIPRTRTKPQCNPKKQKKQKLKNLTTSPPTSNIQSQNNTKHHHSLILTNLSYFFFELI